MGWGHPGRTEQREALLRGGAAAVIMNGLAGLEARTIGPDFHGEEVQVVGSDDDAGAEGEAHVRAEQGHDRGMPAGVAQRLVQAREGQHFRSESDAARLIGSQAELTAAKARGHAWLAADRFTVADLLVATVLGWARVAGPLMQAHPVTAEWLGRCVARPAFAQARAMA